MRIIPAGIAGGIGDVYLELLFPYCSAAQRSRRQNAAERTSLMAALRPPNDLRIRAVGRFEGAAEPQVIGRFATK